MYEQHPHGYNISTMVIVFNSIPHIQLTNDGGLLPLTNTTFDYGRMSYLNSLLITFIIPLFVLLIIFFFYILYLFMMRYLEQSSTKRTSREKFQSQQPCRLILIIFAFITIGILIYGLLLMHQGNFVCFIEIKIFNFNFRIS